MGYLYQQALRHTRQGAWALNLAAICASMGAQAATLMREIESHAQQ
jgi:hypothetical protein